MIHPHPSVDPLTHFFDFAWSSLEQALVLTLQRYPDRFAHQQLHSVSEPHHDFLVLNDVLKVGTGAMGFFLILYGSFPHSQPFRTRKSCSFASILLSTDWFQGNCEPETPLKSMGKNRWRSSLSSRSHGDAPDHGLLPVMLFFSEAADLPSMALRAQV